MKKLLILFTTLGVFAYVFYAVVLPKFLVHYMQSEGAPQVLKEVNREIKKNSKDIVKAINRSGLDSTEAIKLLNEISSSDVTSIIENLNASGFQSQKECAQIIASQFADSGVDTAKLESIITKHLSLSDIQDGVNELSSVNPATISAALPMIKEIVNQELKKE